MISRARRLPTVVFKQIVPFVVRASSTSVGRISVAEEDINTSKTIPRTKQASAPVVRPSWVSMKIASSILGRIRVGTLNVTYPDGTTATYGEGKGSVADIKVNDLSVMQAVIKYGDIGFADSFINGQWQTSNLAGLLNLLIQNRDQLQSAIYGSWFGRIMYRIRHMMNSNTKEGSKKNIHAHYDIGNDFYKLWLDSSMTYSSALFENDPKRSLIDAQIAKYTRVINEIDVKPGDRVLEIGCGWGGFAETAIRAKDIHLTGVTLSTEQLDWATKRMERHGFANNADLRLQDYRDIQDPKFDAIASIEMFEAVGEQYWPSFFQCVSQNLKQGGKACIQTITIRDDLFPSYRVGSDFIQQYIFPGGMLASPSAFKEQCDRAGLKIVNEHKFGLDYARTLQMWHDAFQARVQDVKKVGLDERFINTWEFYLCYCDAAFTNGNIDVVQYTLTHAD
jgi:cyclopropane-fatty-acyl-phospholipid synthase